MTQAVQWSDALKVYMATRATEIAYDVAVWRPEFNVAEASEGADARIPSDVDEEMERLVDARCAAETILLGLPADDATKLAIKVLVLFGEDREPNSIHQAPLCREAASLLGDHAPPWFASSKAMASAALDPIQAPQSAAPEQVPDDEGKPAREAPSLDEIHRLAQDVQERCSLISHLASAVDDASDRLAIGDELSRDFPGREGHRRALSRIIQFAELIGKVAETASDEAEVIESRTGRLMSASRAAEVAA